MWWTHHHPSGSQPRAAMDPLFDAATAYVAGAVTSGHKAFTDKKKLEFYGLYKQATSGKCSTSRPGMFDFAGRAKWWVPQSAAVLLTVCVGGVRWGGRAHPALIVPQGRMERPG